MSSNATITIPFATCAHAAEVCAAAPSPACALRVELGADGWHLTTTGPIGRRDAEVIASVLSVVREARHITFDALAADVADTESASLIEGALVALAGAGVTVRHVATRGRAPTLADTAR